jgi:hypothetical protein
MKTFRNCRFQFQMCDALLSCTLFVLCCPVYVSNSVLIQRNVNVICRYLCFSFTTPILLLNRSELISLIFRYWVPHEYPGHRVPFPWLLHTSAVSFTHPYILRFSSWIHSRCVLAGFYSLMSSGYLRRVSCRFRLPIPRPQQCLFFFSPCWPQFVCSNLALAQLNLLLADSLTASVV